MKSKDLEIQQVAKGQQGVISAFQLQRLGVTRFQVRRRVKSGEWRRELPGVWRLSWAEPTWMQKVWCASLWGGAETFISHRAAARLWEIDGVKLDVIEVSAPHPLRTPVRWLLPHRTAPLPREMRRMRNGVPLTSPSRTLVDLAVVVDDETLQRALEHAFRRKIVSAPELWRVLRATPARGKAGTGRVARLLGGGGWQAGVQSELERQALGLFRRFGLPTPECQYLVLEGDRQLGTVDFAWPSAKVIVEAEGFQFHSGREAWESDIARYNALVAHGWTVLRLTQLDLQKQAENFARALSNAIGTTGKRIQVVGAPRG